MSARNLAKTSETSETSETNKTTETTRTTKAGKTNKTTETTKTPKAGKTTKTIITNKTNKTNKTDKTTKTSNKQLVSDIWVNVCDILIARQMDGTAAALARTSKELHKLVTPKLYDTVRIRNIQCLSFFLSCTQQTAAKGSRAKPSKKAPLSDPPQSRKLIHNVEIECELRKDEPFPNPWPTRRLECIKTLHLKTVEHGKLEDPINSLMYFILDIAGQIPSEHFRWEHESEFIPEYDDRDITHRTKAFDHPAIKSIEFPPPWQSRYDTRIRAAVFYHSRETGKQWCGGTWYTDPDKTEAAGHLYLNLRDGKRPPGSRKPMYIVQIAQHEVEDEMDMYDEMAWARRTAGSITDFAMMEKSGLLDVKLVCLPEERDPAEWREWITGEGLIPGNGVQVDLKAVAE
jgi:hypothetical protein